MDSRTGTAGPPDVATDVLVIGAGPTGLTLACDLARRGVAFRLVERAPEANRASKAKTIQPRSLEVLQDLGAVAPVLERGLVDLPVRFHDASGAVVDRPTMSVRASDAFGTLFPDPVWIGQFDVEAALRQRLDDSGGRVEFGTAATGVAPDETGVTVHLRGNDAEETLRARYVVAADGGRSDVRKLIGVPLVGQTHEDQSWYLGDVIAPGLGRDHVHIWTSPRGMVGLTPLPGSDLWQLQSPIRPGEQLGEPSLALYQALLDERAGEGAVILTGATWLSAPRGFNARLAQRYRSGRVLLAGDAAHVHPPAGGQGMNTGIQDAYNLGWKLAAVLADADDALLDTYGEERIPVARAVLDDSSRKMQRTSATVTGSSGQGLSTALGSLADDITTGLPIAYPTSSLTLPADRADAPVVPGDRAPDAAGLHADGWTGTLFDLLRGPHWTALVFGDRDAPALHTLDPRHLHVHRIGTGIQDAAGELAGRYAPRDDEVVLVRPDGYVAARLPVVRAPELTAYLARWT